MDEYVVASPDSELQHHGTKGMKWGVRNYQNKDGSLTAAGRKRYGDYDGPPKKKVSRKVQRQRKKALEKAREAKAAKKQAEKDAEEQKMKVEEQRKKLLNSNDAKEIYANRHLLTTAELNDRLNRISTEQRLSQLAEGTKKSAMERVDTALKWGRKANEIYEFATGSKAGKDLMKAIGIGDKEKSDFNLKDFYENINSKSTQEVMEANKRILATEKIRKAYDDAVAAEKAQSDAKAAEKAKAAAQKQVDDYNKQWQESGVERTSTYSKTGNNIIQDDLSDGRKYEVAVSNRSMDSFDSGVRSAGRTAVNNSSVLDAVVTYDSDGTMQVRYERD